MTSKSSTSLLLLFFICLCSSAQIVAADAGDVIAGLLGAVIGIIAICAFIGWKSGRVETTSSTATKYEEKDEFK